MTRRQESETLSEVMVLQLVRPSLGLILLGLLSWPPVWAAQPEADRLWRVGEGAFRDGLWEVARRHLERLNDTFPDDAHRPQALFLLGKTGLALGDGEKALHAFRQARTLDPTLNGSEAVTFWEAEALFKLRRFEEARDTYLASAMASPPGEFVAEALYGAAWSEMESGRQQDAIVLFRQLLQSHPTHPLAGTATLDLAREYLARQQWNSAATLLRPFPGTFPQHPKLAEARYLLALADLKRGVREAALTGFERFLTLHPRDPLAAEARLLLARELATQGKGKEALGHYRAFVRDFPENPLLPRALLEEGTLARKLSQPKEASTAWQRLVAMAPADPLARQAALELATLALKEARYTQALYWAEKARLAQERDVREEAWLIEGEAYLRLGQPQAAVDVFKVVLKGGAKNPRYYRALARSGVAEEALGAREKAVANYQEVVAGAKDPELVRWARDRLKQVKVPTKPVSPSKGKPS